MADTFNRVGTHTTVSDLSSVVTITPPGKGEYYFMLQVFDQAVRITLDATTDPTASTGFRFAAGTLTYFNLNTHSELRIIEETSGASIQYQWGRLG